MKPATSPLDTWNERQLDRDWFEAMWPRLLAFPLMPVLAYYAGGFPAALVAAVVIVLILSPTFPSRGLGGGVRVRREGLVMGDHGLVPWSSIESIRIVGDGRLVGFDRPQPAIVYVDTRARSTNLHARKFKFHAAIGAWSASRFVREISRGV